MDVLGSPSIPSPPSPTPGFTNCLPGGNRDAQSFAPLPGCLASLDTFVNWCQWSNHKSMFPDSQSVPSANLQITRYMSGTMPRLQCLVGSKHWQRLHNPSGCNMDRIPASRSSWKASLDDLSAHMWNISPSHPEQWDYHSGFFQFCAFALKVSSVQNTPCSIRSCPYPTLFKNQLN